MYGGAAFLNSARKFLFHSFVLLSFFFLFTSCLNTLSFQSARTTPKGKFDAGVGTGAGFNVNAWNPNAPNFSEPYSFSDGEDNPLFWYTGTYLLRYGLTERLDLGLKLSPLSTIQLDGKYMIYGDQSSKTALAVGAQLGYLGGFQNNDDVLTIPELGMMVYGSWHPNDWFQMYATPRYLARLTHTLNETTNTETTLFQNWAGATIGGRFGNRFGVLGEVSMLPISNQRGFPFFEVNFGVDFRMYRPKLAYP
ncbi:MAG TPA: hypothetical protein DCE41_12250 [Cytophagales bacterium]|nr:hypothetical protein [Cytophagales bacterium]HAA21620.1 hypothetical protein [Cytophagales bacterium]HAP62847.1 hypothetical protein [Cytophagales bacterium]